MAMRITTKGLFRTYNSNLKSNTNRLNDSMIQVQTQRKFNSYAEDPAQAARAFQMRRSYWRAGDQIDNTNYVISKFQTAYSAMDAVIEGEYNDGGLSGIEDSLRGLNDTNAGARVSIGQSLSSTAESIVRMMNTTYGDDFVFAGADGLNVPFEWDGDMLLYRGIDVNLQNPLTQAEFSRVKTSDYESMYGDATGATFAEYLEEKEDNGEITDTYTKYDAYKDWYVQEFQPKVTKDGKVTRATFDQVLARFNEATYVDIGIGMQLNDKQEVVPTSAFNSAISGLDVIGSGLDADGDSKNLAVLMNELGVIFQNCDPESGAYRSYTYNGVTYSAEEALERASVLTGKVRDGISDMIKQHTRISAEVDYLNSNVAQLTATKDQLNEQIMDIEQIDAADAITQMSWAQYCYNAALRIGTNILSQSLIDFMS